MTIMKKKSLFAAAALSAVLLAGCGAKDVTSEQVKASDLEEFATEYYNEAKDSDDKGLIVIENATHQYLYVKDFTDAEGNPLKITGMKFKKENNTREPNTRVDITTEPAADASEGEAIYEFQNSKNLEILDFYIDGKRANVDKVYANH